MKDVGVWDNTDFYMCTTHVLTHYQSWIPDNLSCNETPPCMSLTTWHNCIKSHTQNLSWSWKLMTKSYLIFYCLLGMGLPKRWMKWHIDLRSIDSMRSACHIFRNCQINKHTKLRTSMTKNPKSISDILVLQIGLCEAIKNLNIY